MDNLTKSIDTLIDDLFAEPVAKAGDNLDVASASKTTADAAVSAAPKAQDDAARGAGRPKEISDVPDTDEDGKRAGTYTASIADGQAETENEEAKKQAKSIDQTTSTGRLAEAPKMKDPRLTKSISEEEYAEFEAFKKAQAEQADLKKSEDLKKADDLKKAELENLVKSAVAQATEAFKKENETIKKSLEQSTALVKAMAAQPRQAKSITGIEALEKSSPEGSERTEFTKSEKLDAAERLVMKKSLPMDAVVELENTGTVYRPDWRQAIEAELKNTK